MKIVIYKALGIYYATREDNFYAQIRDANRVQKLADFNSAQEIIDYYCKYFGCKPEDFIVVDTAREVR